MRTFNETVIDHELLDSPEFQEIVYSVSFLSEIGRPPFLLTRKDKDTQETIIKFDELLRKIMKYAQEGFSIQRYKGLGEMNPRQLWETTMDPIQRTLLQIKVDDAFGADEIFSVLMGDQVEPRRQFIESYALDVRNLDI